MQYKVINPNGAKVYKNLLAQVRFMRKERKQGNDDAGADLPPRSAVLPFGAVFEAVAVTVKFVSIDAAGSYVLLSDVAPVSEPQIAPVTRAEFDALAERVRVLEGG